MLVTAIKTHKIEPQEQLLSILDRYLRKLAEGEIVAIASKIISICENRLIYAPTNKLALIQQESEYCCPAPSQLKNFRLTLKAHRLLPNGGIDDSNCKDAVTLLPSQPQETAKKIWQHLRYRDQIKLLGVIITDSNITPLRTGVTGITLGWCGFKPNYDYRGQADLFQQPLKVTQINLLDSLATAATLVMGEGSEQTPLALITAPPKIEFQTRPPTKRELSSTYIAKDYDLFSTVNFQEL